jgi:GT2 family glycosyltransferase
MANDSWVRVIILNFNQPELTAECCKSVLKQHYSNYQVMVVDNGSSEGNFSLLKDTLNEKVIVKRSMENLGYAKGNNLGCGIYNNILPDYYFVLNNDTIVEDELTIQKLINAFKEVEEPCAIIAPLVDTVSAPTNVYEQIQGRRLLPTSQLIISHSAILSKIGHGKKIANRFIYKNLMPYEKDRYYKVDCISGAAFVIKTRYCTEDKIFDENTFLYFEEIILAEQLCLRKLRSYIDTSVIVKHYQGVSTGKRGKRTPYKMFVYALESELYFYKKFRSVSSFTLSFIKGLKFFEYYLKRVIFNGL